MNDVPHFENIWEEAEQLSIKVFAAQNKSLPELITGLLEDYTNLETSELPQEIKTSLRKRYMGEIVFWLTCFSAKDNINVYAALMEEIKLNQ